MEGFGVCGGLRILGQGFVDGFRRVRIGIGEGMGMVWKKFARVKEDLRSPCNSLRMV